MGLEIYGHGVAGEILDVGGVPVERGPGIRQLGRDPGAPGPRHDGS
jgi:hypothetical protein